MHYFRFDVKGVKCTSALASFGSIVICRLIYGNKFHVSDVEERKIPKFSSTSQHSGKRPSENMELAPVAKRQAVESSSGSPRSLSPKKTVAFSQESSLKSLEKGKVKPENLMPVCNHSSGHNMETVCSPSSGVF